MGRDKAFVLWQGVRLLDRQIATLRALHPTALLISGRREVDYGAPDVPIVVDAVADLGPLAGLASVLAHTSAPHLLVLAVDLPHMTPAFLLRLLSASAPGLGVIARTAQGWEPLAAVYPREMVPLVAARLERQQLALQPLVSDAISAGLLKPLAVSDGEEVLFTNINAPPDLGGGPAVLR